MYQSINPATQEVVSQIALDSQDMLDAKIKRSKHAYGLWRNTPIKERAVLLLKVAQYLRNHIQTIAPLMTAEMGKPIKQARAEVEKAACCAEHYATHAERYLQKHVIQSDADISYVHYVPLGVVLTILPWNMPIWLAFRSVVPALMAGNSCLIKHDPHVPECAKVLVKAFEASGMPKGVFQSLVIDTTQTEYAICHPAVQAVSFTGSDKAGSKVAAIAASEIKPTVLELGGSDAAIVLESANLSKAAQDITTMRTINAGQSCIAAKRVIVVASCYDQFLEQFTAQLQKQVVGDPTDEATDVGPLARADLRDNLHQQVTKTIEQGAHCKMGGVMPQGRGFFYPVTLLTNVTVDMCAANEELFGPVAVVMQAKDAQEAVSIANHSSYGLGCSIWGEIKASEALCQHIEAGQVAVNGIVKTDPRLPSGGVKRSGYGRELGELGIKEFTNAQQVWVGSDT